MFEGKPPATRAGLPLDLSKGGQGELRVIAWSELVARFDAAREFRSELGGGEGAGEGSFAPEPARHIAALNEGKPDVNLEDLGNGKQAKAICRSHTNGAASDDPRKK